MLAIGVAHVRTGDEAAPKALSLTVNASCHLVDVSWSTALFTGVEGGRPA
jgi:hypothetical protein